MMVDSPCLDVTYICPAQMVIGGEEMTQGTGAIITGK